MTHDASKPLHDWSAADLSDAYRVGTLSPVDATRAVIDHIERWEPALQATYLYRPGAALAQARASEARWQRGEALGPLDGVPSTCRSSRPPRSTAATRQLACTSACRSRASASTTWAC